MSLQGLDDRASLLISMFRQSFSSGVVVTGRGSNAPKGQHSKPPARHIASPHSKTTDTERLHRWFLMQGARDARSGGKWGHKPQVLIELFKAELSVGCMVVGTFHKVTGISLQTVSLKP